MRLPNEIKVDCVVLDTNFSVWLYVKGEDTILIITHEDTKEEFIIKTEDSEEIEKGMLIKAKRLGLFYV